MRVSDVTEVTPVTYRCGLFGSKGARVVGLCRTMEHGIGSGLPAPGCQARSAEGVMVRRLSVASLDSGAESPVYGAEPPASAERGNPAATPPWADGARRTVRLTVSGRPTRSGVPHRGLWPGTPVSGFGGTVDSGGVISLQLPRTGGATRGKTVTVDWTLRAQAGAGAPRHIASYAMPVVDQQRGRWYVEDIRASTQPMGNPMTWFASSWVVPRGPRPPRTDVHGREG